MSKTEMTMQFTLPCDASAVRGRLKHSYVENVILQNTLPADLHQQLGLRDGGTTRLGRMQVLLDTLFRLLSDPDSGFSPTQLVNSLTHFQGLSPGKQEALKHSIRDYYKREFHPEDRAQRLQAKGHELLRRIQHFEKVTLKDGRSGSAAAALRTVREVALELHRELESLPKGIWLWNI